MPEQSSVCEESIFSAIFKEYAETLHNYLFYKTGNKDLSADLTQEAFTKLWQNCKSVILASAKGYVFKTANNLLINEYNHQKVVLKHESIGHSGKDGMDPAFILEQNEFKAKLDQAIADLPEKQRVVFLLSRVEKKTYKEIAEIIGISKQAVEKRMYNALDSLRQVSKLIR